MNQKSSYFIIPGGIFIVIMSLSGCWAAAAGVGAEAGYVFSQEDRTAGETMNDQLIVSSIKTKLLADSDVSGLDINVDSHKGQVQLKGFVNSQKEIEEAIRIAKSVSGVKGVTPRLIIE